jgi:hypothetical protein
MLHCIYDRILKHSPNDIQIVEKYALYYRSYLQRSIGHIYLMYSSQIKKLKKMQI